MLRGIGASSGYGIGKAVLIKDAEPDYSGVVYSSADGEKKRLKDAIERFTEETGRLKEKLSGSAGSKEAEILEGHIEMISDPFMRSQMETLIDGGAVAEAAVDNTCNMFIDMFSSASDELTRQRASDIKDIRDDVLRKLLGIKSVDLAQVPPMSVLVAKDFTPSMTGKIKKENIAAIITEVGGVTSHSAIIARAMGIPAVLSVVGATEHIRDGEMVIADGFKGKIFLSPDEQTVAEYKAKQGQHENDRELLKSFCKKNTYTANGVRKHVYGNIAKPEDVLSVLQNGGGGIGLFRTEFLFMDRASEPSEDEQYEAYSTVAKAMDGKEVIIRTLDIGGDKSIPYLSIEKEDNPFLGHRAIRYCLDNQELFKRQIRAILRAAVFGNIKIMLPLITCEDEVVRAKKLIKSCEQELDRENIRYESVPVGVMIETPSAALLSDRLAEIADFFSIGTNDLTGYIMAVDRGNSKVSLLYDAMQPAVLKAIEMTVKNAKKAGITVGMCGESAADERMIPKLLSWGLDEFSVTPSSIPYARKVISEHNA